MRWYVSTYIFLNIWTKMSLNSHFFWNWCNGNPNQIAKLSCFKICMGLPLYQFEKNWLLSDILVQIFRNMYISPHFALQKPEKNTSRILSAYIMITNDRAAVHWPVLLTLLSSYFWSSLEILQLYWAELPEWARVSPRCLKISIEAALGR